MRTTENAAYTYDNLGRLVTSDQTSNSQTAQRRFDYDRWGNRTTMWDATSGGAQIQNLTLEQSGGVPTNRISSVSSGKTTLNYSYDAAGNVTNDGTHSYTYDGENRLVALDATAAQYGYDQQNRRVKKTTGGVTWTFTTEADHVFYPGTITFSMKSAGEGQIEFDIDAVGDTNGISGALGFFMGGSTFEDDTWKHLKKQIQKQICGK